MSDQTPPNPNQPDPNQPGPIQPGPPAYGSTPPPPGGYPPPPPGQSYGPPAGNNKKAIWSLVTGILGLLCCGLFTGIPAIILANLAKKEIAASGGRQTGGGLATAGLVLGIIAVAWSAIYLVLVLTGIASFDFSTSTSSSNG